VQDRLAIVGCHGDVEGSRQFLAHLLPVTAHAMNGSDPATYLNVVRIELHHHRVVRLRVLG